MKFIVKDIEFDKIEDAVELVAEYGIEWREEGLSENFINDTTLSWLERLTRQLRKLKKEGD